MPPPSAWLPCHCPHCGHRTYFAPALRNLQACPPWLLPFLTLPLRQFPTSWIPHIRTQICLALLQLRHTLPNNLNVPLLHSILPHIQQPLPPDDTMTMHHQSHRPPTPQSLRNGLGLCGHVDIPLFLWRQYNLPSRLPPHPPNNRTPPMTTTTFFKTLVTDNLAKPSLAAYGAPTFLTYKLDAKARLICDLRQYNLLFDDPPSFFLTHPAPTAVMFVKIDLANCFWSVEIPP